MLENILAWRQDFFKLLAEKRYTVNPAFVKYIKSTVPTTEEEAKAMQDTCISLMRAYESKAVTTCGIAGLKEGGLTTRSLWQNLGLLGSTIYAELTVDNDTELYGYDSATPYGGLTPDTVGATTVLSLTTDGVSETTLVVDDPLAYASVLVAVAGQTKKLLLEEGTETFSISNAGFAEAILAEDGNTIPCTIYFLEE